MTFADLGTPLWLGALALAALSPWCVSFIASKLEQRVRDRTSALLARATVNEDRS